MNHKPTDTARAARALAQPATNEHRFGSEDMLAGEDDRRRRALDQLSTRLAQEQDDHIIEALQRLQGRPIGGPAELAALASRMRVVTDSRNPDAGEVWYFDNVEVLWIGPAKVEQVEDGEKVTLRASREYRHLLPEVAC